VVSVASPTGNYFEISLPFACVNLLDRSERSVGAIVLGGATSLSVNEFSSIVINGESVLRVYNSNSGTLGSTDTGPQLQTSTSIYLSVTYRTS